MLKNWMHDLVLMVQARSGITAAYIAWLAVIVFAALMAFIFVCVAAYDWLSLQMSSVYAGLIMAGIFILIALIGLTVCAMTRRRARERAILARAARARAPSWLLDPKFVTTALQVGRAVGWQRILPVAVLGFMAAQWAREYRQHGNEEPTD